MLLQNKNGAPDYVVQYAETVSRVGYVFRLGFSRYSDKVFYLPHCAQQMPAQLYQNLFFLVRHAGRILHVVLAVNPAIFSV